MVESDEEDDADLMEVDEATLRSPQESKGDSKESEFETLDN